MYLLSELVSHHAVSVPELLVSRDERQARQRVWLRRHLVPLVSFIVVTPGSTKDSEVTRRIFNHGVTALCVLTTKQGWQIQGQAILVPASEPKGVLSIATPTRDLKLATIELEHSHPLGQLWDVDVLTPEGEILSRRGYSLPPRRYLLCKQSAVVCARRRTHQLIDLLNHMETLLNDVDTYNVNQDHKARDVINR